ncbi:MAG: hypothetical protein DWI69_11160 [Chloroflexi bacterium]|nr:MAG: hypothetical protein DWI69_11160 [Chloroflexota bacterium]
MPKRENAGPVKREWSTGLGPGSAGALAGPIGYVGRKDLTESARTANTATLRLGMVPLAQDTPCRRGRRRSQEASRDLFKSWTNAMPFRRTHALLEA